MIFDFDQDLTLDEFKASLFRIKNIPLYGPVLHKAISGPIPQFNYTEEDIIIVTAGAAALSISSASISSWLARTLMISRYTSPVATSVWALGLAGQAYGELSPEEKRGFDLHRHRSR